MGLSDKASIAAKVIAGLSLNVSIAHIFHNWHMRQQEAIATAASRKRTLLENIEEEHVGVQSAAATLGSFRKWFPDGMSWPKLTDQQTAHAAEPAPHSVKQLSQLEEQQLQDRQLALLNQMRKACFTAKYWWTRFYTAVCNDELPPGFDRVAAPGAAVDLIDHVKRSMDVGKQLLGQSVPAALGELGTATDGGAAALAGLMTPQQLSQPDSGIFSHGSMTVGAAPVPVAAADSQQSAVAVPAAAAGPSAAPGADAPRQDAGSQPHHAAPVSASVSATAQGGPGQVLLQWDSAGHCSLLCACRGVTTVES